MNEVRDAAISKAMQQKPWLAIDDFEEGWNASRQATVEEMVAKLTKDVERFDDPHGYVPFFHESLEAVAKEMLEGTPQTDQEDDDAN